MGKHVCGYAHKNLEICREKAEHDKVLEESAVLNFLSTNVVAS